MVVATAPDDHKAVVAVALQALHHGEVLQVEGLDVVELREVASQVVRTRHDFARAYEAEADVHLPFPVGAPSAVHAAWPWPGMLALHYAAVRVGVEELVAPDRRSVKAGLVTLSERNRCERSFFPQYTEHLNDIR